jgi:hypothetical protein
MLLGVASETLPMCGRSPVDTLTPTPHDGLHFFETQIN